MSTIPFEISAFKSQVMDKNQKEVEMVFFFTFSFNLSNLCPQLLIGALASQTDF